MKIFDDEEMIVQLNNTNDLIILYHNFRLINIYFYQFVEYQLKFDQEIFLQFHHFLFQL
jgi:hypothetical protein